MTRGFEQQKRHVLWDDYFAAGNAAYERREFSNAIASYEKALEVAELLERDSRSISYSYGVQTREKMATTLKNLGSAHSEQRKYAEAESYYKRALAIRESVLGVDHVRVADVVHDLATGYRMQGRYDEAQPLYERAARIYETLEIRPRLVMTLMNMGHLYDAQGRLPEAESMFRRALTMTEEAIGANPAPQHPGYPGLIVCLRDYAAFVRKAGRADEADRYDNRVSDMVRQSDEYSASLRKSGRDAEAKKIEERIKNIMSGPVGGR